MSVTHLLIMLYLSVKFHQICFSSLRDIAETRFVTDGLTDRRTDGAILICHPKFLRGHKNLKAPDYRHGGIKKEKNISFFLCVCGGGRGGGVKGRTE